jgi:hypothetical protein
VNDSQRNAVDVDRAGHLQSTDDKGHEIRAHDHCVGKLDDRSPVDDLAIDLRAVRNCGEPIINVEGDGEHRLVLGFVPAREGPTAISGLHLGRGDDLLGTLIVDVGAAIKAAELVIENAGESDLQRCSSYFDEAGRRDDQSFGALVEMPGCVGAVNAHGLDLEFDCIQGNRVGRRGNVEIDRDSAVKSCIIETWTKPDVVARRIDADRKAIRISGGLSNARVVVICCRHVSESTGGNVPGRVRLIVS